MEESLIKALEWVTRNFTRIAPIVDEGQLLVNERLLHNAIKPADERICSPLEHASTIYLVAAVFNGLAEAYSRQLAGHIGGSIDYDKTAEEILGEIHKLAEARLQQILKPFPTGVPF